MAQSAEAQEAIEYAIKLMEDMKARKAADAAPRTPDAAAPAPRADESVECAPPHGNAPAPGVRLAQRANSVPPTSTQHDAELVRVQYSHTGMSGIRALPNAMHPDFRLQLYGALVVLGKQRQAALRDKRAQVMGGGAAGQSATAQEAELAAATALLLAHSTKGPALQSPVPGASGQTHPGVYSALRHDFTRYEHASGDQAATYAEGMRAMRAQRAAANLAGEFVVTAIPSAPYGACAFEEFEYMEDPQARRDEMHLQQRAESLRQRMGPRYLPGGRAQQRDLQKSSRDSCLLHLRATLARDWPDSFIQVFEDAPGCIVASFDRERVAQEGDVTSYMNQHQRIDATVQDFRLVKDTTQWGLLAPPDESAPSGGAWAVFYVYWPPWAARPKVIPPHLAGPRPKWGAALQTGVGKSTREPFGGRTDAGVLWQYDTRPHQHTMIDKGSTLMGRI